MTTSSEDSPPEIEAWSGSPVVRGLDAVSELIGRGVAWLTVLMIGVGAFNAVARYVGRFGGVSLSSNALIETQWYLFAAIFLSAGAYTLKTDRHVRVDVLYARLSSRGRAFIDIAGIVLFLIPFAIAALVFSWPSVVESWRIRETSPDPGGLPRYPLKALLILGFLLLLGQAVVELLKRIDVLRGAAGLESRRRPPAPSEEGSDDRR